MNLWRFFSAARCHFCQSHQISIWHNFWTNCRIHMVDTALESWELALSKFLQDKVEFDQTKWNNWPNSLTRSNRKPFWYDFWDSFSTLSGQIPLFLVTRLKVPIMSFLKPCLKMLCDSWLFLNNSTKISKIMKIAKNRDFSHFFAILTKLHRIV